MKLKDGFEFNHRHSPTIYRASKTFLDEMIVEWGEGKEKQQYYVYKIDQVIERIESGLWTIIEEQKPAFEEIKLGDINHIFVQLPNNEILVIRSSGNNELLHTTITQQDFESIKKIIDLT